MDTASYRGALSHLKTKQIRWLLTRAFCKNQSMDHKIGTVAYVVCHDRRKEVVMLYRAFISSFFQLQNDFHFKFHFQGFFLLKDKRKI